MAKVSFLIQITDNLYKNWIITLPCSFFTENRSKPPKIAIITLTPDPFVPNKWDPAVGGPCNITYEHLNPTFILYLFLLKNLPTVGTWFSNFSIFLR
jgi:hypothetical protein